MLSFSLILALVDSLILVLILPFDRLMLTTKLILVLVFSKSWPKKNIVFSKNFEYIKLAHPISESWFCPCLLKAGGSGPWAQIFTSVVWEVRRGLLPCEMLL